MLAEGCGAAGQPDEGLRQLDEATRYMDATQERWYEADVHRVRGQLLIAVGDPWPKQAFSRPSQLRAVKAPNSGNPLPPPAFPPKRVEARKLLAPIYDWSPKASTRRSSKMQRRCLTN
jgi:hypothetical protein